MRIFRRARTTRKTTAERREAVRFRSLRFDQLEDRITSTTIVWNQTGAGSFVFSAGGNWVGNVAPGPGDVASFTNNIAGNQTINFTAAATLQGIVLGDSDNTNTFSLTGSAITLNAATGIVKNLGTESTNTTNDTIANAIALGAANTALVNNYGSAGLALSGTVSGAFSISKSGAGVVILAGNNSYSGPTTVTGGAQFVVNSSGASPDLAVTGAFYHSGPNPDTGFVKSGAGTMVLTGANTYTGGTTVNAGTVQFGNGTTNGVLSSTATYNLGGSGTLRVANNTVAAIPWGQSPAAGP